MKQIEIKQLFDIEEVNEITLLTIEEAEKLSDHILRCDNWWWLQSPGDYQNYAVCVDDEGDIYKTGDYVQLDYTAVRPAFKINNLESETGDKVIINKTMCTVVSKDLVLADCSICEHRFDKKSNNWETSELKAFIESDEFKAMI